MKQSHTGAAKSFFVFFVFLEKYNDTSVFKHMFLFLNRDSENQDSEMLTHEEMLNQQKIRIMAKRSSIFIQG